MRSYFTEQRKILLDYLMCHSGQQLTVKEIMSDNEINGKISLSAVYRNIDKLVTDGEIQKYAKQGSREFVYQYLDKRICSGHLHLKCTKCGCVFHMDDEISNAVVEVVYNKNHFSVNGQKTMLYGLCELCV